MNNKTVYFMGAGSSYASDFKLPLMKGFFEDTTFTEVTYPNLYKFIKRNFLDQELKSLNLEEVISFLELNIDQFSAFGNHPESYLYDAIREFSKYVTKRLAIPPVHTERKFCSKHYKLFRYGIAQPACPDTIITLNYDLIIDNILWELSDKNRSGSDLAVKHGWLLDRMYQILGKTALIMGERASLPKDCTQGYGFYLKLHGSVDWIYCLNAQCPNHQIIFPNPIGITSVHDKADDLCSGCGSPLVNVIVPPTMYKSFTKFPKLGLIWSLTHQELQKATKIVVIGMSFAASDYYLRWLFKSAITSREQKPIIEVVDKDDKVCEILKIITGSDATFIGDFDKYLSSK